MNWLGRVATAYLGLVVVEMTWVLFAVLRFERGRRSTVIVLTPPSTPEMGICSAVGQSHWYRPKQTPANLSIRPRNLSFGGENPKRRSWLGGDPVATAFYDALSATFPSGERLFMESVRNFRGCTSGPLRDQITAFLSQEATHAREHLIFNSQIAKNNPSIATMQGRAEARLAISRTRPPLLQLAETIALEHLTAILADALLSDSRHLAGAPENVQAMWRWHAIEEIEHKAVAYDTFVAATSSLFGARRWALRVSTMVASTWHLIVTIGRNISDSFTADGINRPTTWARLFWYLLARPGILRQALPGYFAYFLPGFHPWRHDNRALMISAELCLATGHPKGATR
jgi:uncharacterized protein